MKIAIVGSRSIKTLSSEKISKYIPSDCTQIISGGAIGVDSIVKQYANDNSIDFLEIKPNYKLYGRQAPLIRNTEIVKLSDKVLAFWNFSSKGTAHTISECIRLNVPIEIISAKDE